MLICQDMYCKERAQKSKQNSFAKSFTSFNKQSLLSVKLLQILLENFFILSDNKERKHF